MDSSSCEFEIAIEKLVYGGEGLGFHQGRAVFVPFAAPGDRLRVRPAEDKKDYLRAELVEILAPGPSRRLAPCPHAGTCGGCQLQHINYEAQLQAKAGFIRESLQRLGGVESPAGFQMVGSPEWGYRIRTQFHVDSFSGRPRVGYYRSGSHEICEVSHCPLLVDGLNECLRHIATLPPESLQGLHEIDAVAGADDTWASGLPPAERHPSSIAMNVGPWSFEAVPGGFFQSNRFLLERMIVTAMADHRGRDALDLFCGAGFFTLPLTERFETVRGVEENAGAIRQARRHAALNRAGRCQFEVARVQDWVRSAVRRRPHYDLILVDPPRTGLSRDITRGLGLLVPDRIVYVSCNPATFARDVARLKLEGFGLTALTGIDLFPQTFHVEVIGQLTRY
ncbi:MAG: class I SAM-dependent RNA methyltransferase [Acidobacteria bacterium]|nr:class I SAM-dependent RNA methyltransferase [Acidobacteriota bacterium]